MKRQLSAVPAGVPPIPAQAPVVALFSAVDSDGELMSVVSCSSEMQRLANVPTGGQLIEGGPPSRTHYRVGNAWLARPPAPSSNHTWNRTIKVWEDLRSLGLIRKMQIVKIKAAAAENQQANIRALGGNEFQADTDSAAALNSAAQAALADPSYIAEWILADNTTMTLSASQLKTVTRKIRDRDQDIAMAVKTLREQINTAELPVAVEAINWVTIA